MVSVLDPVMMQNYDHNSFFCSMQRASLKLWQGNMAMPAMACYEVQLVSIRNWCWEETASLGSAYNYTVHTLQYWVQWVLTWHSICLWCACVTINFAYLRITKAFIMFAKSHDVIVYAATIIWTSHDKQHSNRLCYIVLFQVTIYSKWINTGQTIDKSLAGMHEMRYPW